MKKLLALLIAGSFVGCSSLNIDANSLPFNNNSLENISQSNKDLISEIVTSTSKVYGVGSTKISPSGAFVLEEEARKKAYKDLEGKVEDQVENFFSQHMVAVDGYTKKVYNLALSDLEKYAVARAMKNTKEGQTFVDNGRKYVVLTNDIDNIFNATKTTFDEYNKDLISRLSSSKDKVVNSTYIQIGPENEIAQPEVAPTEGVKEEKTYDLPLD